MDGDPTRGGSGQLQPTGVLRALMDSAAASHTS